MNQKHRQEIDDRCGKDHAVEAVENTAVARNQLSVILDALISFDCGCRKVSDHGDQPTPQMMAYSTMPPFVAAA